MVLFKNLIKIAFIQLFSFFCFGKKSKVIFYHDIHSNERYTDMSTPIELFQKHIQIQHPKFPTWFGRLRKFISPFPKMS